MIEYIIFANTALILILSVLIYFKDSKDVDFDKEIINLAKPSKRFLKSFSKPAEKQNLKLMMTIVVGKRKTALIIKGVIYG